MAAFLEKLKAGMIPEIKKHEDFFLHAGLFIAAFAGIWLILPTITRPLFIDESRGVNIAMLGLKGLIAQVALDNHPPLYYLVLSLWIKIFGISEPAVRSLSLLCYSAGVFLTYRLSYKIYTDKTGAFFSSLLYIFALITIAHSTNARMYSLLSVFIFISYILYAGYFIGGEGGKKRLALLVLVNTAGIFTHYWFLFVILGQGLFAAAVYGKKFRGIFMAEALPVILLFAAWGRVFFYQAGNGSMSFITFREGVIEETFNNFYYGRAWILYLVILIAVIAGLLKRVMEDKKAAPVTGEIKSFFKDKNTQFLLFSLALILYLPYLVTKYAVPVYLVGRYTIVTFIPFVILFAGTAHKFSEKRLLWLGFIFFTALYIIPWFGNYRHNYIFSDKWKTELIMQKAEEGDMIMFAGLGRVGNDYYLKLFGNKKSFTEFSFPAEIDEKHPCWGYFNKMDAAARAELEKRTAFVRGEMKKRNLWLWVVWGGYSGEINDEIRSKLTASFYEKLMIRTQNGDYVMSLYETKL